VRNLQIRLQPTFLINFILVDVQCYDCIFSFALIKYHGIDKKKEIKNCIRMWRQYTKSMSLAYYVTSQQTSSATCVVI